MVSGTFTNMRCEKIIGEIKNIRKYMKHGGVVKVTNIYTDRSELFAGKVALVTGATSGIGMAIAKKLLCEGASVVITGRSQKKLDNALEELNSNRVKGLLWDLTAYTEARMLFNKAVTLFGKIDIAVNNAGVYSWKSSKDVTVDDWDAIINTNLKGFFFLCQVESEYFKQIKSVNKIINITSMEGVLAGFGPYYASKWGVNGLTQGMAKELASYNTIVNAIAPGPVKTNINADYFKGQEDSQYNPDSRSLTGRMVLLEEIASLASYLASDISNSIIGQVIVMDGGISLR